MVVQLSQAPIFAPSQVYGRRKVSFSHHIIESQQFLEDLKVYRKKLEGRHWHEYAERK